MRGSSKQAKAIKLPFGGAGHVDFALVRGAICVTEKAAADRHNILISQVVRPMIAGRLYQMACDERTDVEAQMLLQNNAASSGPERGLAERKVGISRTTLEALEHIAANVDLFFAVTLAELNIFHVMDTLDETIAHSDLNDRDDLVNKNRMPAARAFTQQSPVMCVSRRTQGV